jgi:hypothetical protein
VDLLCACPGPQQLREAPPSDLSSRPKRSAVEGPAVRPSRATAVKESTTLRLVIPTEAKRSGGSCRVPHISLVFREMWNSANSPLASLLLSNLNPNNRAPLVIPTAAEGPAVRLSRATTVKGSATHPPITAAGQHPWEDPSAPIPSYAAVTTPAGNSAICPPPLRSSTPLPEYSKCNSAPRLFGLAAAPT